MFQFPTFAPHLAVFWVAPFGYLCFFACLAAPHNFSQLSTSFFAHWLQGIHRVPFLTYPISFLSLFLTYHQFFFCPLPSGSPFSFSAHRVFRNILISLYFVKLFFLFFFIFFIFFLTYWFYLYFFAHFFLFGGLNYSVVFLLFLFFCFFLFRRVKNRCYFFIFFIIFSLFLSLFLFDRLKPA